MTRTRAPFPWLYVVLFALFALAVVLVHPAHATRLRRPPQDATLLDSRPTGELICSGCDQGAPILEVKTSNGWQNIWAGGVTQPLRGDSLDAAHFMRFLVVASADASGGAQSDTATGAKVADKVLSVIDLSDLTDVTSDFESTVSIADHVSQTTANLATKKVLVIILAQS